jgi:hypothetical protein
MEVRTMNLCEYRDRCAHAKREGCLWNSALKDVGCEIREMQWETDAEAAESGRLAPPPEVTYTMWRVWFRGIENLTIDDVGNVCWRGHRVERYDSFYARSEHAAMAARELADACIVLESYGLEVNFRNACKVFDGELTAKQADRRI